jgi:DNA-binding CsgD family transcriptional regulator
MPTAATKRALTRTRAAKAAPSPLSVPLAAIEEVFRMTADDARGRYCLLTPREAEVAELMASGKPNRQIAEELRISPKTLDIHRANALLKLRSRTVADLANLVNLIRLAEVAGGAG